MSTRLRLFGSLALLAPLAACQWFGGGGSDGTPEGAVHRKYSKSPEEVSRAASEALQELGVTMKGDEHDALGGRMTAQRNTPAREEITVVYNSVDDRNTGVSVAVGKGDRRTAELLQDRIAQKLGTPAAKATPGAGSRAEADYAPPVDQCLAAAEEALKDLRLNVTHKETHDTWAQVESRAGDAVPVTVRVERTDKDKTKVSFSAGTTKSEDNRQLAERLKSEFEKKIGPGAEAK